MHKQFSKDKKALSSLGLIILLLTAAIIGGIISYLWVTGYYVGLKEKIPTQDTVAITRLSFNPQNATGFNVTLLNPSFSPSEKVGVSGIAFSGPGESTLHPIISSTPSLTPPWNIPRGTNQTFNCKGDLSPYVNQTVQFYAFVVNGSGSTNIMTIPYTQLFVSPNFDTIKGVKNYTIALRNPATSHANLTVEDIRIDLNAPINATLISPTLPYTLARNQTVTLLIKGTAGNWTSYATTGGPHTFYVTTKEGYSSINSTQIPKVALAVQQIAFNENDTKHFNVTVKNLVSTNTPLNVSKIEALANSTILFNVTPSLTSHNNGIPGNSTTTFTANWDWTNYRETSVIVTVYTLQGVKAQGLQTTKPASILTMPAAPILPDSQHAIITVHNSQYASKPADITKITVTLINSTENQIAIVQPTASPYTVGIGNRTMFTVAWNWQNYLNKTVNFNIYTTEGLATFRATITPSTISNNYKVYLTAAAPVFNAGNTTQFEITIDNDASSVSSATINKISVILANGTEIIANFTPQNQPIAPNTNATFTCTWNWSTYRNKNLVIQIFTGDGLKAIYVTKTS